MFCKKKVFNNKLVGGLPFLKIFYWGPCSTKQYTINTINTMYNKKQFINLKKSKNKMWFITLSNFYNTFQN